jgi:hypothetical protein
VFLGSKNILRPSFFHPKHPKIAFFYQKALKNIILRSKMAENGQKRDVRVLIAAENIRIRHYEIRDSAENGEKRAGDRLFCAQNGRFWRVFGAGNGFFARFWVIFSVFWADLAAISAIFGRFCSFGAVFSSIFGVLRCFFFAG